MKIPGKKFPQATLRILLAHLNSNGDCLYATTVARQIKSDFPGCHLTWAIASSCAQIIQGNPDVDTVWRVSLSSLRELPEAWRRLESEALSRRDAGEFDMVFFTQFAPNYLERFDGSIRSSLFRGYPGEITVPVAPVIRLSDAEVMEVTRFAEFQKLRSRSHVILVECSPKSGQSFMTPEFALDLAGRIIKDFPHSCILLSSDRKISAPDARIVDASVLSLRENAELTKYCSLLIGCSSGISWICTSDWASRLPMVQLIDHNAIWVNSMVNDHNKFGLPSDNIVELTGCTPERVHQCVRLLLDQGIAAARRYFHERIPVPFQTFLMVQEELCKSRRPARAAFFVLRTALAHPRLLRPRYWGRHLSIALLCAPHAVADPLRRAARRLKPRRPVAVE